MGTMNFYTQNGWAGSNYDSKLYPDSMYIELKEGTCIPFVEGSRSAERGYNALHHQG